MAQFQYEPVRSLGPHLFILCVLFRHESLTLFYLASFPLQAGRLVNVFICDATLASSNQLTALLVQFANICFGQIGAASSSLSAPPAVRLSIDVVIDRLFADLVIGAPLLVHGAVCIHRRTLFPPHHVINEVLLCNVELRHPSWGG